MLESSASSESPGLLAICVWQRVPFVFRWGSEEKHKSNLTASQTLYSATRRLREVKAQTPTLASSLSMQPRRLAATSRKVGIGVTTGCTQCTKCGGQSIQGGHGGAEQRCFHEGNALHANGGSPRDFKLPGYSIIFQRITLVQSFATPLPPTPRRVTLEGISLQA